MTDNQGWVFWTSLCLADFLPLYCLIQLNSVLSSLGPSLPTSLSLSISIITRSLTDLYEAALSAWQELCRKTLSCTLSPYRSGADHACRQACRGSCRGNACPICKQEVCIEGPPWTGVSENLGWDGQPQTDMMLNNVDPQVRMLFPFQSALMLHDYV